MRSYYNRILFLLLLTVGNYQNIWGAMNEIPDSISDGKSLNDIRFANFQKKDWLDNEYIRTLRQYLNSKNEGQFVLCNVQPYLLGGLFIQIVFLDRPDDVYTSWVYSDVDVEKGIVTGYQVRQFKKEEDYNTGLTKEQILQQIKEHPELKIW